MADSDLRSSRLGTGSTLTASNSTRRHRATHTHWPSARTHPPQASAHSISRAMDRQLSVSYSLSKAPSATTNLSAGSFMDLAGDARGRKAFEITNALVATASGQSIPTNTDFCENSVVKAGSALIFLCPTTRSPSSQATNLKLSPPRSPPRTLPQ